MKLLWSRRSRADRRAILRYIARPGLDNIKAAQRWDTCIVARAEKAAQVPTTGHRPPELRNDPRYENILQVWLRTYRIIYRVEASTVVVLRVWEGHQLLSLEDLPPPK